MYLIGSYLQINRLYSFLWSVCVWLWLYSLVSCVLALVCDFADCFGLTCGLLIGV